MKRSGTYLDNVLSVLCKMKTNANVTSKNNNNSGKYRGTCTDIRQGRNRCAHVFIKQGGVNIDVLLGIITFTYGCVKDIHTASLGLIGCLFIKYDLHFINLQLCVSVC